ncbi:MAG: hypothetical protein ABIG28_01765 [archaeon]
MINYTPVRNLEELRSLVRSTTTEGRKVVRMRIPSEKGQLQRPNAAVLSSYDTGSDRRDPPTFKCYVQLGQDRVAQITTTMGELCSSCQFDEDGTIIASPLTLTERRSPEYYFNEGKRDLREVGIWQEAA